MTVAGSSYLRNRTYCNGFVPGGIASAPRNTGDPAIDGGGDDIACFFEGLFDIVNPRDISKAIVGLWDAGPPTATASATPSPSTLPASAS